MAKKKVEVQVVGKSASAQKALKDTNKQLTKLNTTTGKSKNVLKNFKAGWIAAAAVVAVGTKAIGGAVKAAAEQEKQELSLAAAMKQAGTYTQEAFKHNLEYAQSLQAITTYGDEAILGVQRMLTNFGVEGQALDDLTEATLNLAAAKGMDLKSAADLVAKSVGSSTNALTRYGIEVTGAAGSSERMNTAVENINKIFGGSAAAQADTYAGKIKKLKNVWGDLTEVAGREFITALEPAVDQLQVFLKSEQGIVAIRNAARGLVTVFFTLYGVIRTVVNVIEIIIKGFIGVIRVIMKFGSIAIDAFNKVRGAAKKAVDYVKDKSGYNKMKKNVAEATEDARNTIDEGWSWIKGKVTGSMEEAGDAIKNSEPVTAVTETTKEAFGDMADKIRQDAEDIKNTWGMDGVAGFLGETWSRDLDDFDKKQQEKIKKFQSSGKKLVGANKKLNGQLTKDNKKSDEEREKSREYYAEAGVRAVVNAAAEEKATVKSVAAALIEAEGKALAEKMVIRAIASAASFNFVAAAGYSAAAAGIIRGSRSAANSIRKMQTGGDITEHIIGFGQRSGAVYEFGEGGTREKVTPEPSDGRSGNGNIIVEQLIVNQPMSIEEIFIGLQNFADNMGMSLLVREA